MNDKKEGNILVHATYTGPQINDLWYNYKSQSPIFFPLIYVVHTHCRYFDGKSTEFDGKEHTHIIYFTKWNEYPRQVDSIATNVKRRYWRCKQKFCLRCESLACNRKASRE